MLKKKERVLVARKVRAATGIKLPEAATIAKAIVGGRVLEACASGVLQVRCPHLRVEVAENVYSRESHALARAAIYVEGPRGIFDIQTV